MPSLFPGLKYVDESSLCLTRQRWGKGFRFFDEAHQPLVEAEAERVSQLVIPPNWENVSICADEWGHIQAVGYDSKGRKQYLYHPSWQAQQQQHKFNKMVKFGEVLPAIRQTVEADMRRRDLSRERVVGTVVWLLENTFIRIGNAEYVKQNQSYGLTTLREKHVTVTDRKVEFQFKGKSGVYHTVDVANPRVARTLKRCIELPGYELFQYLDEAGQRQQVDSRDVNDYLRSVTGEEFSAKDFRTWGGTVLSANHLHTLGQFETETEAKKNIVSAVKEVASHLGNLPSTCKKYYIHPSVIQTYAETILVKHFNQSLAQENSQATGDNAEFALQPVERATWTLIKKHPLKLLLA